jgi:predicted alpha/beta hydrolase
LHGLAVLALAFVVTACGGGQSRTGVEHVHFPASDGVLLDGRLYGRGDLGVVLVHMGRPIDTQSDWAGVARLLARKGFHALTYDRRGVCIRGGTG